MRNQCEQVNSREPCILIGAMLPREFSYNIWCRCSFSRSARLIMLQPFRIFFFRVKPTTGTRTHGEKCAIYSRAAAGIGPQVPRARYEVVTKAVVWVTAKARNPQRTHLSHLQVSLLCFGYTSLALIIPCESDKLVRGH